MSAAQSRTVAAMGGWATITLTGGSEALLDRLARRLVELEERWSRFRPDSELSRLNAATGLWHEVSTDTVLLVDALRAAHAATFGAFDPTLLPDSIAIGDAASRVDPTLVTVLPRSARAASGLSGIELADGHMRLPAGVSLDSGGLGKGLAADLLVREAREAGAAGALVAIDGDLAASGVSPRGGRWQVSIEDPRDPTGSVGLIDLGVGGVATSSRARRRWTHEGIDVHHIIDPATHQSAATEVLSATVSAPSGALAEAVATCAFIWRVPEFIDWLPSVNAAAVLVLDDGSVLRGGQWEQAA